MNTESCEMTRIPNCGHRPTAPGQFFVGLGRLTTLLPSGAEASFRLLRAGELAEDPDVASDPAWTWDGNEARPTLEEPIATDNWRGRMTDGRLVSD